MANLNVEYSTDFTNTSESNSNVPYRLKVYYMITKRTENSITFNLDVEVNYPGYWSSNGAWVKYLNNARRCNPNATTDVRTFYASTQSSYRNNNSWWLTGLTINNLNPTDITTKISIGFSNDAYTEAGYNYQDIYLAIPIGYTSIGMPGIPRFEKEWFTDSIKINWSAGTNGVNNNITKYVVFIDKEFQGQHTENSFENGLNLTYVYDTTILEEGSKIKTKIRTYDSYGNYIDTSYSSISTKNIAPSAPEIKFFKDGVEQIGNVNLLSEVKIGGSKDNGGIFTSSGKLEYRLNIDTIGASLFFREADDDNYITLENSLLNYVGQEISVSGTSSDGYSQTKGQIKNITVGKTYTFIGNVDNSLNFDSNITISKMLVDNSIYIFQRQYFEIYASYNNINFYLVDSDSKVTNTRIIFNNILQKVFNVMGIKGEEEQEYVPIYFKIRGKVGLLSHEIRLSSSYKNIKHSVVMNKIDNVLVSEKYYTRYYNDIPVIKNNLSVSISSLQSIQYPYSVNIKLFSKSLNSEETYSLIKENIITFEQQNDSKELTYLLSSFIPIDKDVEAMLQISYKRDNIETILSNNILKWDIESLSETSKKTIQRFSNVPFTISSKTTSVELLPTNEERNGFTWDLTFNWNISNGEGRFILDKVKLFDSLEFSFNNYLLILNKNKVTFENQAIGENTNYKRPLAKIINFIINDENFSTVKALENNKNHRMEIFYTYREAFLKRTLDNPTGEIDLSYTYKAFKTNTISFLVSTYSKPTAVSNIIFEKIAY